MELSGDDVLDLVLHDDDCVGPDAGERYSYETLDRTADALPDLVVHVDECTDPDLWAIRWDVYPRLERGRPPRTPLHLRPAPGR